MSEKRIREIEQRLEPFSEAAARAKARLANERPGYLYFGVMGLECEVERYTFGGEEDEVATLRRVEEPPGMVALGPALKEPVLLHVLGRYSLGVRHELLVPCPDPRSAQGSFDIAWFLFACVRIKSRASVLVPAAMNHSWDCVAGIRDGSCEVTIIEDHPRSQVIGGSRAVTVADLDWVNSNLERFIDLWEQTNFRLAAESYSSFHHFPSHRLMLSALWAGVEGLFGVGSELTFRLAASVATTLEPRGPRRKALFKEVQKLYDGRSKAVHGSAVKPEKLREQVDASACLLARLLVNFIEKAHIPTQDEIFFT